MGKTARRQNFESQRSRSGPPSASGPSRGALKPFSPAQASQPIEKVGSARENPRKSKSNQPLSNAYFGAKPRLADEIQMARGCMDGAGIKISPQLPSNPLKNHDRPRLTAENGGLFACLFGRLSRSSQPNVPAGRANIVAAAGAREMRRKALKRWNPRPTTVWPRHSPAHKMWGEGAVSRAAAPRAFELDIPKDCPQISRFGATTPARPT
jgi:hypothetical protein